MYEYLSTQTGSLILAGMLYASQIRAARALLVWKQEDLAREADVGLATLGRIEQGGGIVQGNFSTILRLQSTLELHGIRFIRDEEGYGVRLDVKAAHAAGMESGAGRGGGMAKSSKRSRSRRGGQRTRGKS
jgi:transcriptional regulator with XRE-family HTH domain